MAKTAEDRLQIAVATSNEGKLREFTLLFGPLDCEIFVASRSSLDRLGISGIPEPVEDGETFYQNAYVKARYWADILGMPCLADDSGLTVRALGGEPGVRSARWGGRDFAAKSGEEQSRYLLERMEGIADRAAAFVTCLVLARPFQRRALAYRGYLSGEVALEAKGGNGFGYDRGFLIPELGKTLAELGTEEKNGISHRGRAILAMRADWDEVTRFLRRDFQDGKPGL